MIIPIILQYLFYSVRAHQSLSDCQATCLNILAMKMKLSYSLKVRSSDFWLPNWLVNFGLDWTASSIEKPNGLLILNLCLKLHERHVYQKLCKKGWYYQQIFYSLIQGYLASHLCISERRDGKLQILEALQNLTSSHEEFFPFSTTLW